MMVKEPVYEDVTKRYCSTIYRKGNVFAAKT